MEEFAEKFTEDFVEAFQEEILEKFQDKFVKEHLEEFLCKFLKDFKKDFQNLPGIISITFEEMHGRFSKRILEICAKEIKEVIFGSFPKVFLRKFVVQPRAKFL